MPDEPKPTPEPIVETPIERPPLEDVMGHLDYYLREHPEAREALRTHSVVAGIAGEIGERIANTRLAGVAAENEAKAAEDALQRQLKMADEDPEGFAAQFTEVTRGKIAERDLRSVTLKERKELANLIGQAVADLPEGKFSTDELAEISTALVGVPDQKVIAVYTRTTNDIIARKRAERMTAERIEARVRDEREAWETEAAGKRVKASPAPNLRSGTAPQKDTDEPDFIRDKKAWDNWYESTVLKKTRAVAP